MSTVTFSQILRAAAHKGETAALIADSVFDAAVAYAMNGGAKNLIDSVVSACQTTEKGKPRSPAAGTAPALILSAMNSIAKTAGDAGARPVKGGPDIEARRTLAHAYAATIRAAFITARDSAEQARKTARDEKAAEKAAAPAAEKATDDSADDSTPAVDATVKRVVHVNVMADMSDAQLAQWATDNPADAARMLAVFGAVAAVGDAVKAAKKAASAAKKAAAAPVTDKEETAATA